MLDSGAYSAWTRRVDIDVGEYIEYVRENIDYLWSYVSLDAIPGAPGRAPTRDEVAASRETTRARHVAMRRAGLRPIPVFHYGEPMDALVEMLREGEDYIGLGGLVRVPMRAQTRWLDRVFTMLTNEAGVPIVRTHGFGTLAVTHMRRYPFYTVDGTSWIVSSGYGNMLVPAWRGDGTWDYLRPTLLGTSDRRGVWSTENEYNALSPAVREVVRRYCQEVVGCTPADVRYSVEYRRLCFLIFYREVARQIGRVRFPGAGLRRFELPQDITIRSIDVPHVVPVMAGNIADRSQKILLSKICEHLQSYYQLRLDATDLPTYVKTPATGRRTARTDWRSAAYLSRRAEALIRRTTAHDPE